jgi:hypothetical protein
VRRRASFRSNGDDAEAYNNLDDSLAVRKVVLAIEVEEPAEQEIVASASTLALPSLSTQIVTRMLAMFHLRWWLPSTGDILGS